MERTPHLKKLTSNIRTPYYNVSMRYITIFLTICTYLSLTSCGSWFDTHPYDINIHGETDINTHNIAAIEKENANKETFRVAFISDTHLWHSDTRDEVANINNQPNIDFVIHLGDLTDTGTTKEFEWSRDILQQLNCPYVALIGNHDFLGTGDQTYNVMYGQMDFSFIAGRVKFICLDTNATEYDYLAAIPNFDFLEEEMTKNSELFDRTVLIMHAPPYSDQFNNNVCKAFRRYLDFLPGLMCCVYGHCHNHEINEFYNDGLRFYGIDNAEHRNYRIFTFTPDGYEEELVNY